MRKVIPAILLGFVLIISIVFYELIDMWIDHQCYQLKPNDNYKKTVCEKYWK